MRPFLLQVIDHRGNGPASVFSTVTAAIVKQENGPGRWGIGFVFLNHLIRGFSSASSRCQTSSARSAYPWSLKRRQQPRVIEIPIGHVAQFSCGSRPRAAARPRSVPAHANQPRGRGIFHFVIIKMNIGVIPHFVSGIDDLLVAIDGYSSICDPSIKNVAWMWCCLSKSRICGVVRPGPSSKVRAITFSFVCPW